MKNSFVVQYAVHLWLASIGLTGFWGGIVAYFAALFLGNLVDRGIVELDITIDKVKEALKDEEWKTAAEKAYGKAISKVYTEPEKAEIRKQYLDILRAYASFGDGMPNS